MTPFLHRAPGELSAALRVVLAVLMAFFPVVPPATAAVERPQQNISMTRVVSQAQELPAIANYDVRDDESKHAQRVLESYREKAGKERNERIKEKKEKIRAAHARLEREIPGLAVAMSDHTGAPEIVGTGRGRQKLTDRSNQPRESVARGFLQRNADLYGLSQREVAQLRKVSDYQNPGGNIGWVEYQQEINGLPLFRGNLRFALSPDGEIVRTVGNIVPALEDLPAGAGKSGVNPEISASDAVIAGAKSIGVALTGLTLKEVSDDETTWLFDRGPFEDDVKVSLEYFPLEAGVVTLAWSMILIQDSAAYYIYVSAEGGELLWRKNIVDDQTQPATYVVYNDDSPAPLSPSNSTPAAPVQGALIPRTSLTLISQHPSNNLGWLTDGSNTTTGNNVDAGLDLVSPDGIEPATRAVGSPNRVFDFAYNPAPGDPAPGEAPTAPNYRFGEVVNMFYWTNRYHDDLYALGFTEAARNFQQDNFGRGGAGNDRVRAEGQDSSGVNNANMLTPPDGTSGRMQMYIFTGPTPDRTSGLDQEIVIHELTHGTSNRLHNNANGLTANMSRGMGEGWSDFYARALLSSADEDINGIYAAGGYSTLNITGPTYNTNYYYGIRRFPYALITSLGPNGKPYNPMTFADIDASKINLTDGAYPRGPIGSSSAHAVHNIGEIWCSALLEVRARLINRLGFAAGNQRALQLVTDGMKLDPVNPTLLNGRDSILAASAASGGDSLEEMDIWAGFAARGMGFGATVTSASVTPHTVTESFDLPNLVMGSSSIVSDSCDNGGVADPGEAVVLAVQFTNPFSNRDINNVVVTVGSSSVTFGTIPAGQTVTGNFSVTIPSSSSCGGFHTIPVVMNTALGVVNKSITLQLGLATGVVPAGTFSTGNIAAPLPDVATTEIPINVTQTGAAGNIRVKFRLNHTFDGDLEISLVAPDGTTVMLSNNRGGSGDNFGTGANDCSGTQTVFDDNASTAISAGTAPFAGTFRPDSPLSAMKGRPMNGVWKLRVTDTGAADVGVLGCVTLEFTEQLYFCCGVPGFPVVQAAPPATLVAECASAANGAPDPGEVVTMNFPLQNVGSGLTTNLVATLQNSGGVTSAGGPQTYGVLSPVGDPVSRPFQFAVDSSAVCGADVVATFALSDGGTSLGTVSFNIRVGATNANTYSFSNPAPMTIPATGTGTSTGAPSSLYPSPITVSGVAGTVVGIRMSLNGFTHTFPSDVDMLLVGPGGQKYTPFSDVGGSADVSNITFHLEDGAPAVPTSLVAGTFRPSNLGATDRFPAPAPAGPYEVPPTAGSATFASVFGGSNPNGTWSLYVVDDAGADVGSLSGGWALTFFTADPSCAIVNAPQVSAPTVSQSSLWPANHTMRDVTVDYSTGTDCAVCSLSVSSNEPVNGTGDGDTSPDWEILGSRNLRLRAERSGTGTGRIYTITVTCTNGAGTSVQTVPVYVAHNIGSPGAGSAFRIGTPVDFAGTFWDSPGRTHTARWNFDNLSTAGTVTEPSGSRLGSVRGTYSFADPGVYRVTMNVTDDRNVTASVSNAGDREAIVIAYDPTGGYVVGGGWYQSAAGAMTFGYNSKYHANGRNIKGEAQMSFGAGTMQFEANSLDYLTISGSSAQVAGQGRLNGEGPYLFLLSMIDGPTDLVRIKIWHKVTGQVVYDSQPGASDAANPTTAVGAGSSIVIQK